MVLQHHALDAEVSSISHCREDNIVSLTMKQKVHTMKTKTRVDAFQGPSPPPPTRAPVTALSGH